MALVPRHVATKVDDKAWKKFQVLVKGEGLTTSSAVALFIKAVADGQIALRVEVTDRRTPASSSTAG